MKGDYPIVAVVESYNGNFQEVLTYTNDGAYYCNDTSKNDLFFTQEKHEGWINVYKDGDHFYSSMDILKTKEEAEALSCRSCIATVKVEWEE